MSKIGDFFINFKLKKNESNLKVILAFSFLIIMIIAVMTIMPFFVSGNFIGLNITSDTLVLKQLAPDDLYVKRSFEYVDEKATQEKKEEALKKVYPIFTYDVSKTYEILNRVENFNKNIEADYSQGVLDSLVSLTANEKDLFYQSYLKLSDNQKKILSTWVYEFVREIIKNGYYDVIELSSIIDNDFQKITLKGFFSDSFNIEEISNSKVYNVNSLLTEKNIEDLINSNIKLTSLYNSIPLNILYFAVEGIIEPNVKYDIILTEKAKEKAINGVKDVVVFIPAGTKILTKDTIVREADIELLKQVESNNAIFSNLQIISRLILIILITFFSFFWFLSRASYTFRRVQFTSIYLVIMLITLIGSLFLTSFYSKNNLSILAPLLPVLFGTLFLKNITTKKTFGYLFTIQYSLYSILFPGSSYFTFFYLCSIGISFIYIIDYNNDRINQILSIFKGILIATFMTFILYSIQGYPFRDFYRSLIFIIINILVCFMLERAILPFVDSKLNIPTIFRLEELSNLDNKLLVRLKMTAQGTFTHSVNVSELAYDAAKAISANADLCRVAALYHDVGKMDHPEYFTENQDDEYNKHDELTPSMSGSIIRSHVKLGVDLCKEENLPKELIDIISEHHGNDIIQYFYNEAVKDSEKNLNRVDLLDYTYNGNPPQSRESAILMIADSVEAASHSQNTSAQKVGRLISNIVRQKFDRGQLNDSHLDLTELTQIEKSLERSLVGKLHTRVKYQNDIEKANTKE